MTEAAKTAKAEDTPKGSGKGVKVRMRERSYRHAAGDVVTVPEDVAEQLVNSRAATLTK